jgi:hypothetical protein
MIKLQLINAVITYYADCMTSRLFRNSFNCRYNPNRQTSGESASLPQYLGCNTVFDMRLRVTFLRRKTVSLQLNIAHRE